MKKKNANTHVYNRNLVEENLKGKKEPQRPNCDDTSPITKFLVVFTLSPQHKLFHQTIEPKDKSVVDNFPGTLQL